MFPLHTRRKILQTDPGRQPTLTAKGYPRSHLIDPSAAGGYPVVSRCVRRAWLCGEDPLTGQSFEHRRGWLEQRIHHLAECFALSVWSYAVMSNHVHRVVWLQPNAVDRWSDDEVVARWRKVQAAQAIGEGEGQHVVVHRQQLPALSPGHLAKTGGTTGPDRTDGVVVMRVQPGSLMLDQFVVTGGEQVGQSYDR